MKVVDANVAIKWYVPEPGSDAAHEILLSQDVLMAPAIIRLEVLAGITKCVRENRSTGSEAEHRCNQWLGQLEDRAVMTVADDELLVDAIRFSIECKHYLIDCLYLALSRRLDATLVTFDKELAKSATRASIRCQLMNEDDPN